MSNAEYYFVAEENPQWTKALYEDELRMYVQIVVGVSADEAQRVVTTIIGTGRKFRATATAVIRAAVVGADLDVYLASASSSTSNRPTSSSKRVRAILDGTEAPASMKRWLTRRAVQNLLGETALGDRVALFHKLGSEGWLSADGWKAVAEVWSQGSDLHQAPSEFWLDAFQRAGGKKPRGTVTLYRGATEEGKAGLSWTDNPRIAFTFAHRNNGRIWTASVHHSRVAGYIEELGESEYIVNTAGLDITEHSALNIHFDSALETLTALSVA